MAWCSNAGSTGEQICACSQLFGWRWMGVRCDPPGRGTFHFAKLVMPPLTKTCPKMVLSHKRGSLCVKDIFAKKFLWCRDDSITTHGHQPTRLPSRRSGD